MIRQLNRLFCFPVASLLLVTCVSIGHADWPRFLGADGNGVSTETELLDQLSVETVKVRWRVPGGVGMSAIAIAEDLAITMWNTESEQLLVALNIDDGKAIWTTSIARDYKNSQGDGPRATPTIADGRVYAFSGDGMLAAVDLKSGKVVWKIDAMGETDAKPAEYGFSSSPLVTQKHVVVHVGANRGAVAAFNKNDGSLAWTAGSGAAGYSSPTLLDVAGEQQIVSLVGSGVIGIDPQSGQQRWSYDFKTPYDCNTASPIVIDGNIFISAGENHGCVCLNIQNNGDQYEVGETWSSVDTKSVMRNEWQTSVVVDDFLYGFDNVGSAGPTTHLSCIKASTGEVVWRKTRFGKGNLVLADGKLWITTMDGELVLVKADPKEFQELGRIKLFGKTRQSLSISGGRGYVRDDAEVLCLELRK
jgi:outer membrane protein assembly factor BamB